jgi:hypothetical protein
LVKEWSNGGDYKLGRSRSRSLTRCSSTHGTLDPDRAGGLQVRPV